jgi:hypothetical protein
LIARLREFEHQIEMELATGLYVDAGFSSALAVFLLVNLPEFAR